LISHIIFSGECRSFSSSLRSNCLIKNKVIHGEWVLMLTSKSKFHPKFNLKVQII
jgi:hypothetical protein